MPPTLNSIVEMMTGVILNAVPVAIFIALAVFIWGLVKFIAAVRIGQSDEVLTVGKNRMMWGIIGLFLAVSVWGIVEILRSTFIPGTPVINEDPPVVNW